MKREFHVRFCEHLGGQFPGVTRPVAESFFATLKTELIARHKLLTRAQARAVIFEYIEVFYNRQRSHSYLDFMSPDQFELARSPLPVADNHRGQEAKKPSNNRPDLCEQ